MTRTSLIYSILDVLDIDPVSQAGAAISIDIHAYLDGVLEGDVAPRTLEDMPDDEITLLGYTAIQHALNRVLQHLREKLIWTRGLPSPTNSIGALGFRAVPAEYVYAATAYKQATMELAF